MGRKLVAPISGTGHFVTAEMLSGLRVNLLLMAYITQDGMAKTVQFNTIKQTDGRTDGQSELRMSMLFLRMKPWSEERKIQISLCMFLPKIVSSSVFHLEKVSKNVTFCEKRWWCSSRWRGWSDGTDAPRFHEKIPDMLPQFSCLCFLLSL